MNGKTIVFKKEVMSPVFGSFLAGDVAKNVDAKWAGDLIAAGVASETSAADQQKDADAAADAAGRLTSKTAAEPVQVNAHTFSPSDHGKMQALGVVAKPAVGQAPAQSAGPTTPAPASQVAPAAVAAPAAAAKHAAGTHAVHVEPAAADARGGMKRIPAPPTRQNSALSRPAAPAVDAPTKAAKGGTAAKKAATGTKAGGRR